MKSLIKLTLTALLTLSMSACDKPWWYKKPTYSILQILHNNQPNTVYNKTMITYHSGYTNNGIIEFDTLYFQRKIKPGDTAQINVKDLYESRFYNIDTVMVHLKLSDSQQWNHKIPRMYIRNKAQSENNFIETIRF